MRSPCGGWPRSSTCTRPRCTGTSRTSRSCWTRWRGRSCTTSSPPTTAAGRHLGRLAGRARPRPAAGGPFASRRSAAARRRTNGRRLPAGLPRRPRQPTRRGRVLRGAGRYRHRDDHELHARHVTDRAAVRRRVPAGRRTAESSTPDGHPPGRGGPRCDLRTWPALVAGRDTAHRADHRHRRPVITRGAPSGVPEDSTPVRRTKAPPARPSTSRLGAWRRYSR